MDRRLVELPGPAVAAATDGTTVWCAAAGRLLAFDPYGSPTGSVPAPPGLRSLAAVAGTLVAAGEALSWLDPGAGKPVATLAAGQDTVVVAGGGAVWAASPREERAWPLPAPGALGAPVAAPGLSRCAAAGDRLWWTSRHDTLLRGGPQPVDLGVRAVAAMTVCAGAVWLAATDTLLQVNAWSGRPGPGFGLMASSVDCAGGVLAGGCPGQGLFVLDPARDEGPRRLADEPPGTLGAIVGCPPAVWALSAEEPAALVVPLTAFR
ncbi:hypothetical protein ABGB18_01830 [Nonomuraea sp. B12E4]|uniref:hypothetical protein n=1 Tax=Nonomuraea sp. B12E4 TaxID=3153564 RepID=UPI00325D3249